MENNNKNSYDEIINNHKIFINRELSLIEFNKRVLKEAEDNQHPLLERLKFITILSSNLDEFFMIRVAGLKQQISAGVVELSFDGMTPNEQLQEIRRRLEPIYERQAELLNNEILPALQKENIYIHEYNELSEADKIILKKYFYENLLPVLTPLSLDPAHPFPRLINRCLNIGYLLCDTKNHSEENKVAFVQVPQFLPRFVNLNRESGYHFVLIEQIIKSYSDIIFPGLEILTTNTFRVTRDADIEIAEDEAEDLLTEIAEQIKQRRWGRAAVRLEVETDMKDNFIHLLMKYLELEPIDVYAYNRHINLPDFMQLMKVEARHLKDTPFQTRLIPEFNIEGTSIFDAIKKQDFIVHHPYDSFTYSVLKFMNQGAEDPDVVAIKITLYRVGLNSAIVSALKKAAEKGKEVTAFVELKARFDEENNIIWARELEQMGVHVVYGVIGLKTHCKIAMIVRHENNKMRTYLHLSTGNYNHVTARLYTDLGIFTANPEFASEAIHLFNYLTGYSSYNNWKHFLVAPINLRQRILELINRETELHTPENPGLIFIKMNALAHKEVIQALYKASIKGVKIKFLVRGVCCLIPGIKGVSENIEVRSIIGRFLEHSRVFYFRNGGNEEIYLASADWMTRNLHNRVELMFPIYDKKIQNYLKDLLDLFWMDNKKSWRLLPEGKYEKIKPEDGEKLFSVQEYFLEESKKQKKHRIRKII